MADERIPVALLTGFLGSGKTTILNAWLRDPALSDAAVIVNEFGEVGIDHALIASSNEHTIELTTGCLCCAVRGDLVNTLRGLHVRAARGETRRLRAVIIETTGLADPAPIIHLLMTLPVARRFRLGRVVATIDGVHGAGTLDRHREAVKQVAMADEAIITKLDLGPAAAGDLRGRLTRLNPGLRISRSQPGRVPAPPSLAADIYDPAIKAREVADWLNAEAYAGSPHRHDDDVRSFCLSFDEPLRWREVSHWLDALAVAHPESLLRVKGIAEIAGRERPIVVQAVQSLFHPPVELAGWPPGPRRSRFVFIVRGLDAAYVKSVLEELRGLKAHRGEPAEGSAELAR